MNKCWFIVNWTIRNTIQWNSNQNTKFLIHEHAFENAICEMAAIFPCGDELIIVRMLSYKLSILNLSDFSSTGQQYHGVLSCLILPKYVLFYSAPGAGRLSDRHPSRIQPLCGAVIATLAMALTGQTTSLIGAVFSYGVLFGKMRLETVIVSSFCNKNKLYHSQTVWFSASILMMTPWHGSFSTLLALCVTGGFP